MCEFFGNINKDFKINDHILIIFVISNDFKLNNLDINVYIIFSDSYISVFNIYQMINNMTVNYLR